jgi:hypothetical protein
MLVIKDSDGDKLSISDRTTGLGFVSWGGGDHEVFLTRADVIDLVIHLNIWLGARAIMRENATFTGRILNG